MIRPRCWWTCFWRRLPRIIGFVGAFFFVLTAAWLIDFTLWSIPFSLTLFFAALAILMSLTAGRE